MNIKELIALLATATEQGAIHSKAQVTSVSAFKQLSYLTVGNMEDITYANPDKMNIRSHADKVARLTHKFVIFYTYNDRHSVIQGGSLEALAGFVEFRIRRHAADMAIVEGVAA